METNNHYLKFNIEDAPEELEEIFSNHLKDIFKKELPFNIEYDCSMLKFEVNDEDWEKHWEPIYDDFEERYFSRFQDNKQVEGMDVEDETIYIDDDIMFHFIDILIEEIFERKISEIVYSVGYDSGYEHGEGDIYVLFK